MSAALTLPRFRRPLAVISLDLFGFLHLLLWILCAYLFHQQVMGVYAADTRAHMFIVSAAESGGDAYSLLHSVVRGLASLVETTGIIATPNGMFETLLTVVLTSAVAATSWILVRYFDRYSVSHPFLSGFVPLALMVVAMLILPGESKTRYIGTGTPNPWHNPTYIFAKPLSIAFFMVLLGFISKRTVSRTDGRPLAGLALLGVLSMWAKPSFLISFLPATAIYLVWRFLGGTVSLRFVLSVGAALAFSLVPLVAIQSLIYGSNSDGGVIFTIGEVWRSHSSSIPVSVALGMAFPLYVVFASRKNLSPQLVLSLINYILAGLIYFFLAEDGSRFTHGNFGWGYMFGMLMMFFAASDAFFFHSPGGKTVRLIGWTLFLGHLLCGLYYFGLLLGGGNYL